MTGITKVFPGVKALSDVDFRLLRGEVHVLFGENGAGKSTLISILSGVDQPTSGLLKIDGQEVSLQSVHDAAKRAWARSSRNSRWFRPCASSRTSIWAASWGVAPLWTVVRWRMGRAGCSRSLASRSTSAGGFPTSPAPSSRWSRSQAFFAKARVLILDEPTASLTEKETRKLFGFIAKARSEGVGIIYISHRIQEFAEIADRISILRDGRMIGTVSAKDTSEQVLVELMTGRSIDKIYPEIARRENGQVVLSLENIVTTGVHGASVDVRAGEVLGVAGLVGSGKSRVWRSIIGLQPVKGGRVTLNGKDVTGRPTRALLDAGVFYLPPDRKTEGLQLAATARENISLSLVGRSDVSNRFGFVSPRRSSAFADAIAARVDISKSYLGRAVSRLSAATSRKCCSARGSRWSATSTSSTSRPSASTWARVRPFIC